MQNANRQARLEARTTPEVLAIVKHAAGIEGRSLTNFVVAAAMAAARQTIEQTEIIRLSSADQVRFFEALMDDKSPPAPAMVRAFEHHRRLTGGL